MRKTYTGKQQGLNDDLAICLQLAVAGAKKFVTDPKYDRFKSSATTTSFFNDNRPTEITPSDLRRGVIG